MLRPSYIRDYDGLHVVEFRTLRAGDNVYVLPHFFNPNANTGERFVPNGNNAYGDEYTSPLGGEEYSERQFIEINLREFGFNQLERDKYLRATGFKNVRYRDRSGARADYGNPVYYGDACFNGRTGEEIPFSRGRLCYTTPLGTPGYLHVRGDPSPGLTDDRELTYAEFLLTKSFESDRILRQARGMRANEIRPLDPNSYRKLGYNQAVNDPEIEALLADHPDDDQYRYELEMHFRVERATEDYLRTAFDYHARTLWGHEFDKVSLAQARDYQTAYDNKLTDPDSWNTFDPRIKRHIQSREAVYRASVSPGNVNARFLPNLNTGPLDLIPSINGSQRDYLDGLIFRDALYRLEYMDSCRSLDDVFFQRCGKFDPYRAKYSGSHLRSLPEFADGDFSRRSFFGINPLLDYNPFGL